MCVRRKRRSDSRAAEQRYELAPFELHPQFLTRCLHFSNNGLSRVGQRPVAVRDFHPGSRTIPRSRVYATSGSVTVTSSAPYSNVWWKRALGLAWSGEKASLWMPVSLLLMPTSSDQFQERSGARSLTRKR